MTPPQPPIRTAIIGYGGSGKLSHTDPISQLPEFEIRAICDTSPERREEARSELSCEVYDRVDRLLEHAHEIDLVSVVTRTDTHCQIVEDCLNAGLHTVVTKPWAINRQEAERMLDAQATSGKTIFPWMPMSWSPEYLKIQELVESGAIGDVFLIRRYIAQFWRRNDWQTLARYGGGYLLNWGMHIVQPILDLVSSPVRRVFGQMQRTVNPGDVEDNFLASIEFENGVRGIAEFTQGIEGLPSFMVQGTNGMILSDGSVITLLVKDPGSNSETLRQTIPIEGKRFGDELEIYRDIARALRDAIPIRTGAADAYYGTLVLDAIRKSHEERQVVDFSAEFLPHFKKRFHPCPNWVKPSQNAPLQPFSLDTSTA